MPRRDDLLEIAGYVSIVWPGMKNVVLIPRSASSPRMRRAPTAPNSPREMGVGDVAPRKIEDDMASKSKVRQTRRRGIGFSLPLGDRLVGDLQRGVEDRQPLAQLLLVMMSGGLTKMPFQRTIV